MSSNVTCYILKSVFTQKDTDVQSVTGKAIKQFHKDIEYAVGVVTNNVYSNKDTL